MSDSSCYYYDSDHNRCLCYDNHDLDNLLAENTKLRKENAELRTDVDLMNCQLRARAEERDDLQAENAKLREQIQDAEHEESVAWDRVHTAEHQMRKAKEHNAKLRKLCEDMVDYGEGAGNGMAEFFADRMRELGIEVK